MTKLPVLLGRKVAKVLPSAAGLESLLAKRKIRLYQGFDPTGRLHIGHAVGLRLLQDFADAGHEVIFLFGTGTVLVGDPSQRETGRTEITDKEIQHYIKGWKDQAAKVVDFSKITVKENGQWLTKLSLKDIVNIASQVSATQLFKRESFQNRIKKGDPVWYHETMYPLLQGYDSVVLDVDLEIGGTDQEFNMLMGRELLKKLKNKEKYVLSLPLLLGPDGEKMSASKGNCIWLDDSAGEMYGKLMSVKDELLPDYLSLATEIADSELGDLLKDLKTTKNPRDIKAKMASEVVKLYYGEKAAQEAATAFDAQFKNHSAPSDMPKVKIKPGNWDVVKLLTEVKLVSSKSEARRIINQKGMKLNGEVVSLENVLISAGDVVQVGKRKFVKIK